MTQICPFNYCDCDSNPLPDIRGFRRLCHYTMWTEHYNIFCTLCGTGMGYSSKSLNKHENGHKHRQFYKAKEIREREWSRVRHLLCTEFCREIFVSFCWRPKKFKTLRKPIMRLVDINMLVFEPWTSEIRAAIWDWGHDIIESWEVEKRCEKVAFKEVMALIQLGFLRMRLSYKDTAPLDRKAKMSILLATEGHIIMNRICHFIDLEYSWSERCFI